jgi:RNA polymerase-interacting CarD/CdnL/TRCF family regulator
MVEQWIKPLAKRQNRRADMIALRNQYSGEQGNTSRRIAAAEKLRDTLHYKKERALPFSTFLDKLQKMFNILEEENKFITEPAKSEC